MPAVLRFFLVVTLPLSLVAPSFAQPPAATKAQDPGAVRPQQSDGGMSLVMTASLLKFIEQKREEVRAKQAEAAAETVDLQRLALLEEVRRLQGELADEERRLEFVTSGIDQETRTESELDILGEIEDLVRPLIDGLKELTSEPRQLDQLKDEIASETQWLGTIERGIERVRELERQTRAELAKDPTAAILPTPTLEGILAALERIEANWTRKHEQALGNRGVLEDRVRQRERERKPFWETAQTLVGGFFRERGLNVLLALLAFCTVLFGLRWLYRPFARRVPRDRQHRFSVRLLSVIYHVLVGVLALTSALVVLDIADDWVLLGLAGLLIIGLAWAGKQALPRFYQEARLLLNIGDVREGERVFIDGLPWRVDRLHVQSRLVNPALTGGVLRLPLRDLIGMRSRPTSEREPWFPCFEGDWVLVDGLFACVLVQTPQTVELVTQSSRRSMPTSAFLAASPTNLSAGFGFRVNFGIDYGHQAIATTEVPAVMHRVLEAKLAGASGGDGLVALKAQFAQAGSSSLDYAIVAEFKGSSAQYYLSLQRSVQRILVELCNEQGWVIPFPQLTVHRA